jgi:hypothetical protein
MFGLADHLAGLLSVGVSPPYCIGLPAIWHYICQAIFVDGVGLEPV